MTVENTSQLLRCIIFLGIQIQMQHRILLPGLFQISYGQAFEQFTPALKIRLQRGKQKTLAETPRTAKKIGLSGCDQTIDQGRLIHIDITFTTYIFKSLYTDR